MKYLIFSLCFFSILLLLTSPTLAQEDDLLSSLDEDEAPSTDYISGTFKGTRIINTASVDLHPKGELLFIITHRFGRINTGVKRFWGLDDAVIRLGFEYGLTDKWSIGLGRSGQETTYDFFSKYKLFRQSSGAKSFPVSIVWNANMALKDSDFNNADFNVSFSDRLFYTHQLLIARKFVKQGISFQLTPTFTHNNVRELSVEQHDTFALGFGARVRLSPRLSLIGDYYYLFDEQLKTVFDEPLAFALEIETGGHVFHLIFSNSSGMTEKLFINRTLGDWGNGDIHFGFNISRTFPLKQSHGLRKKK